MIVRKTPIGRFIPLAPRDRAELAFLEGGAEGGDDGALEGVTVAQGLEDGELFPFEAAEIDGVVEAMNREIHGRWFETRDG